MNKRVVKVLIVGESPAELFLLSQHLEQRGGQCQFVSSNKEAARLFSKQPFDLVLCSARLTGIHMLISSVTGSSASLFCSDTGEANCWWVPTILHGMKCLGASPLRPSEFVKTLNQVIDDIMSSERAQGITVTS
jgi:response regulator RpfG family c-di-GMP phosphodiesterase